MNDRNEAEEHLEAAPSPAEQGQESAFSGALDRVSEEGFAFGWARREGAVFPVTVEMWVDGSLVGHAVAESARSDLEALGWGACAFKWTLPPQFFDSETHTLDVRFPETATSLKEAPKTFRLERLAPPGEAGAPAAAEAASVAVDAAPEHGAAPEGEVPVEEAMPPANPAEARPLLGYFDAVEDDGWAAGWAYRKGSESKLAIEAWIDGELVGEVAADQYRADLKTSEGTDCAFWFGIPEDLLDGKEHEIDLRAKDNGEPLPGSPRSFCVRRLAAHGSAESTNILPSSAFDIWPRGLHVAPSERLVEVVPGWYFDYRRGTEPKVILEAEKPSDVGLPRHAYAMRVTVQSAEAAGYMRLIVPLDVSTRDIARYRFSLGVRRPRHAADGALHVSEIFLGAVKNLRVQKLSRIHRTLKPKGTQRVMNVPAVTDPAALETIEEGAALAVVIDFKGEGDLLLFSPSLVEGASSVPPGDDLSLGDFEDPQIRGQAEHLVLSPIWRRERVIIPGGAGKPPTIARARADARTLNAVPFIQIVVPVFNAAADVEDLLRSILRSTDTPYEVLLADDGSGDYAYSRISAWQTIDPRVRYHRQSENVGYTRNINIALQSSVSDYVVLLNSDTIVTPGWLRKLYNVIATNEKMAGVGPLSNAASWQSVPRTKAVSGDWINNAFDVSVTPERINAILERMDDGVIPEFPLLNGFCTLFRRSAIEDVGYYDDASFPRGYGEENDLCIRLGKAGWSLGVAADTYIHHSKSKSFGNAQRKELSKAANEILRAKHPEVNFQVLEQKMQNDPTMNRIRASLLSTLAIETGADMNSFRAG